MLPFPYVFGVADPISDAWNALLSGNTLCVLGFIIGLAMLMLIFVILRIRKVRSEQNWAYNPDKHLKLRWRRG